MQEVLYNFLAYGAIDLVMKPLSRDLRERVVAAYAAGEQTQRQVAQRFGVSQRAVSKRWRQQRQVGHLRPLYPQRQDGYKITVAKRQRLEALLTSRPDHLVNDQTYRHLASAPS
jgi:transposase